VNSALARYFARLRQQNPRQAFHFVPGRRITSIGRYVEFGVEVINNEIQSIIKAAGTILEEGFWSLQHFKEKERFHLQSE
jgi:hypothetical protein